MVWSIFLFIFKFCGPALLSSTEDAGAIACVFALPVGHILGCLLVVFSRTWLFVRFPPRIFRQLTKHETAQPLLKRRRVCAECRQSRRVRVSVMVFQLVLNRNAAAKNLHLREKPWPIHWNPSLPLKPCHTQEAKNGLWRVTFLYSYSCRSHRPTTRINDDSNNGVRKLLRFIYFSGVFEKGVFEKELQERASKASCIWVHIFRLNIMRYYMVHSFFTTIFHQSRRIDCFESFLVDLSRVWIDVSRIWIEWFEWLILNPPSQKIGKWRKYANTKGRKIIR